MPQRDMKSNTQVVDLGVLSLSGTTPAASDWVDTLGFDTCTFMVQTNTVTAAGSSGFTFEAQDSDDTADGSAVPVSDLELIGSESDLTVTDDGDDNIIVGTLGYVGDARYARLEGTGSSGTNADVRVIAILQKGARMPDLSGVGTSVPAT